MRSSVRRLPALAAALMAPIALVPLVAAGPPARAADTVVLGGVHVTLRPGTRQVVAVDHTRGYHARVSLWTWSRGGWHRRLTSPDGRIGYGGLVRPLRRRQGTGTTPLGTVGLTSVFGTHAASPGALPYRRIRRGDYWVEDNASRFYNRYRNKARGGFRWWLRRGPDTSERLLSYRRQYEWSVVTDYNHAQVRHRGAGIFLHVNGRGATAGCVSAPRWFLRDVVARLDPAAVPIMAVDR
jgi:L,D-peptidoglycan transpeptidase YkuD (ErfK/YbiS/YcfS/YnhG family)